MWRKICSSEQDVQHVRVPSRTVCCLFIFGAWFMHPIGILRIAPLDNAFFLKWHAGNIHSDLLKVTMQILIACVEYQGITYTFPEVLKYSSLHKLSGLSD